MSKFTKTFLITLGCLLMALPAMAQYTEFIVEPGGSGTTYPDLASAVATAQGFTGQHRIVVRAGTYNDFGVVIDHSQPGVIREIVGDDKATVFFEAPVAQWQVADFLDVTNTDSLTISGLTVTGYQYGVVSQSSGDVDAIVIEDCIFDDNGEDGYSATPPYQSNGGAIRLYDCDGGLFQDLEIMNGERGIRLDDAGGSGSDANQILACVIHDMDQYGIGIYTGGDNNTIDGCEVFNCQDRGIQLGYGANAGNVVRNCTVYDNNNDGIVNSGATSGIIENNTVYGNAFTGNTFSEPGTQPVHGGIVLYPGGNGVTIRYNTVYGNGDGAGTGDYGIFLDASTFGNPVYGNCLYDHDGVEGYDAGSAGTNNWNANYYEVIDPADGNDQAANGWYDLDGAAGERDWNPLEYDNSASGPTTVDVWDNVTYDIDWTVPACAAGDELPLESYQFTVSWDPDYLEYVDADYDEGYLGSPDDGALYVYPIGGDPASGTLIFAASNPDLPGIGDGRLAWVEFQAIKTGGVTISVASYYRDPDNNDIPAGSTPLNVTIQDSEDPVVATFAVDDPIGNNTFGLNYGMTISGTCTDNYDLYHIWYKFDGTGSWKSIGTVDGTSDTFGPFAVDMTLVSGDGAHTLDLMVRDESSNEGYYSHGFTLDNTGPDVANLTLTDLDGCGQAGYSRTAEVAVAWDNPDGSAVEYQFYEVNNPGWQPVIAGNSPTTYTFPSVEGANGLYVRQFDIYGNQGGQIGPVNITLDWTPSTPSGLTLDGGAAKTADVTVDVFGTWSVASGSIYFNLSEDKADLVCGDPGWTLLSDIAPTYHVDFDLEDVEGTHWVFRACMDIAGNVSAIDSASIELDKSAPVITSVVIEDVAAGDAGGEDCTDSYQVQVTVTFTDDGDATTLELSNDGFTTIATYSGAPLTSPYVATYTMNPTPTWQTDVTIEAKVYDDIGNFGTGSDDIFLDPTPPTVTSIELQDAAATEAPVFSVQWTNDNTFDIEVTGASADVVELVFSEDNFVSHEVVVPVTAPLADPYVLSYTYQGVPTTCGYSNVWMKTRDCAANESTPIVMDGIVIDEVLPTISTFTGPALTNSLSVTLTLAASDDCSLQKMRFSEDDPTFASATWEAYAGSKSFVLDDKGAGLNDVPRTIYVQVADAAGNIDSDNMSIVIDVDMTLPTGSFKVVSTNPLAADGYTSTVNVTLEDVIADPDVVEMKFRNFPTPSTGSPNTAYMALAGSYSPWALNAPTTDPEVLTVQMRLKDGAGNQSAWIPATIEMSPTASPNPAAGTAFAIPGNSAELCWGTVADAQKYMLRYNFTNEYPGYPSDTAPHPLTPAQGIAMAQVMAPDTVYTFTGPQPDVYSVSIWVLNNYGIYSANPPNTDIITTDYRLGDYLHDDGSLGPDGCVAFDPEFVVLGLAYLTSTGDAEFRDSLDIAPTSDASETGYPMPDGNVDFEDLVIFAKNYSWSRAQTACNGGSKAPAAAATSIAKANISAEMPGNVRAGTEFTVPVSISNPEAVLAYHFAFEYDRSMLELVSVEPGEAYASQEHSFFYLDEEAEGIDLHSAVIGTRAFDNSQLATITFRAISSGPVTLRDRILDVRDWDLNRPQVAFSLTALNDGLPNEFALSQNYPNPFNPTTAIELSLPVASQYKLTIYNVLGQEVKTFEGFAERGYTTINWDASEQASGIYLYRVQAGSFTATRKMVLLK